jgi:hypothetical protein
MVDNMTVADMTKQLENDIEKDASAANQVVDVNPEEYEEANREPQVEEVVEETKIISVFDFTIPQFEEYVWTSVFDLEELDRFEGEEKGAEKPRKGIMTAIKNRRAAIEKEIEKKAEEAVEKPLEGDKPLEASGGYSEVYHFARTIAPGGGLSAEIMSPEEVKDHIEKNFFDEGYELLTCDPIGFGPDGLSIIWIFGKPRGRDGRHREIWHIQRNLGRQAQDGQMTGFMANTYIKSFLTGGWNLFSARPIRGASNREIPMFWVLVR